MTVASSARASIVKLAGLLCMASCGTDAHPSPPPPEDCSPSVIEADLALAAVVGSAVDETGDVQFADGARYVVSSNYFVPRAGDDGTGTSERYRTLYAALEAQLARDPGLLALQVGHSGRCRSERTLAVWSSEDAMYAFVASPAHAAVMAEAHDILEPGFAVLHWDATRSEQASFAELSRRIASAGE